jgi:hypothetical protein
VLLQGAELYREESRNPETLEKYGIGTPDDWMERNIYTPYSWQGCGLMLMVDLALFGPIGATIWAVQMMWIPVTAAGVPNRTLLADRLNQALIQAKRHDKQLALLFLDLDGFKNINDRFGHAAGDKLLQRVAARLLSCIRGGDRRAATAAMSLFSCCPKSTTRSARWT